ncbi:MAG: penicillin-binding protein [Candidatus Parcubacteria bacterium]|jgi:1A family penicillin-binding protein|nr:penicillin-binding protein [Candidatus Parcubacteria bacterium]
MKKDRRGIDALLHNPHPLVRAGFVVVGIGLVFLGGSILWVAFTPIPALNTFDSDKIAMSTKIYDRTGKTVLYDLNRDMRRTVVPLADVPDTLQKATLAIEDSGFYSHGGVSFTGIARALLTDITSMSFAQGGSTITQQVVKNTILTGKKSVVRKVQEWILAIRFEGKYTKDEILEFYFNVAPFGGTIYGAESASLAFFGKSAKDVSLAEAAYLAAIPQRPTYYSPYGNNREALDERKDIVLGRMLKLGYITQEQHDSAKKEKVTFSRQQNNSIIAPHFVFYIEQQLEELYGPEVGNQGYAVITTLDADLQSEADTIVNRYALANASKFNASNAALVAIDPKTGQILAMVGSRDYFDKQIDGNYNAALALRQPGSSFKPFVYAAAVQKGFTRETAIFDLPTQFSTICSPADTGNGEPPCYAPGNYDNKFRGPMTFTTALAQSINIPAVKTLYLAGIPNVLSLAKAMGLTSLGEPKDYGLSLALGAAEVRLLDLTSAYAGFANEGMVNKAYGIIKVTDAAGKTVDEFEPEPTRAIDPEIAREISSMLSNNEARQPEYPPDNPFNFPGYDVAAKTGTTDESRDAWTVGYSPSIAVGVWAGNNDNSPMVKEIAGYIVAPMWNEVMRYAIGKYPKEFFNAPPEIPADVPGALRGLYAGASGVHDILHWVSKDNPRGGGTSQGDGQYPYWEYSLGGWFTGMMQQTASTTATTTPEEPDDGDDSDENDRDRDNN